VELGIACIREGLHFELFFFGVVLVCMQASIWVIGSVLILGVLLFFSFRFKGIETPNYKLIKMVGEVEIREYPQLILAQTK